MGEEVRKAPIVDKDLVPEVQARRNALFNKYVMPFRNMIYYLCIQYSSSSRHVEENYTEVLVNLYRGIETYNPERPIRTWIHIVTKRHVWVLERRRKAEDNEDRDKDISAYGTGIVDVERKSCSLMELSNYEEFFDDDVLWALSDLKDCYRDAFILRLCGYSLKEIAEMQYEAGNLKVKNVETIKSRLRVARDHLKARLDRNGERIPIETVDKSSNPDRG